MIIFLKYLYFYIFTGFWTYLIPKERNSSKFRIPKIYYKKTLFVWEINLKDNFIYLTNSTSNQEDNSKIIGIAFKSKEKSWKEFHRYNSIRLGIYPSLKSKGLERKLTFYSYQNGKRIIESFDIPSFIDLNEKFQFTICLRDKTCEFQISQLGQGYSQPFCFNYKNLDSKISIQTFPYFGGDEKTKKPIEVKIKKIY